MQTQPRKKIALFFDGTWNRADQVTKDGRPSPTNIARLFEAVCDRDEDGTPQIVHYVEGVGTRWSERLSGGGFGYGISDNIKDGYRFLVSNYTKGDEIYLFGFSRGAYTARSLAGMIRNVGILRREWLSKINDAYDHYKDCTPELHPDSKASQEFREEYTWGGETIRFLGVFDTVGALGAPFGIVLGWIVDKLFGCRFHDTRLSNIIESAYHAVAIDERRLPFQPTLMMPNRRHDATNFEQRWFPGVHSNVGGGYGVTGLSDLTLEWMASHARLKGLALDLKRIVTAPYLDDLETGLREEPQMSQTVLYRAGTVLLVKLPGVIRMVPKQYRDAVRHVGWNGDFLRPIDGRGDVDVFVGQPPSNPDAAQYAGMIHPATIRKINNCWATYLPPNVVDAGALRKRR